VARKSCSEILRDIAPAGLRSRQLRQGKALGLGHAVYCARADCWVDAPLAVLLPNVLGGRAVSAMVDLRQMTPARFGVDGQAADHG